MKCSGCLQKIEKGEVRIACTSQKCVNIFHDACIKAEKLKPDAMKTWICPDCIAKNRKGGDNTHTPLRQPAENVTIRKKNPQPQSSTLLQPQAPQLPQQQPQAPSQPLPQPGPDVPVAVSTDALKSLSSDVGLMRQSISDLWAFIRTRLDELDSKLSSYDLRIKSLEALENENAILKATICNMQQRINNETQNQLRNELEIAGLEETPGENPYHLAMTTAQRLGVDLLDADLNYASRVGPKNILQETGSDNSGQLRRPLVVSFTRRVKRDEFLKQSKARRTIRSKDIVGQSQGSERIVYVNERLTSEGRRLFRDARSFANKNGYKYCWINRGYIFVRKRDASTGSPAIRINNEDDLNRLLNSTHLSNPETSEGL
jgi:hypothetical protein